MPFAVMHFEQDGAHVVRVDGEFDLAVVPSVRAALESPLGAIDHQVIDLTGATFIDSTAIGLLVERARRMREAGGSVAVVCVNPPLLMTFEIVALDDFVPVHDSLDAALAGGRHLTV